MTNRVERWMLGNSIEALERKMEEWSTESVQEYFLKIFDGQLSQDEIAWAKYLQTEFDYRFFYPTKR